MKRTILTLTAIALTLSVMAQSKPVTKPIPKDTAHYQKIVKVSVSDYSTLISLAEAYKQSVIYNPKISDKTKEQQDVDMWLYSLPKRIALDSVKIGK